MWTILDRFIVDENFEPREGGMAEVYRAVDMKQEGKIVAIKLIKHGVIERELTRTAFSREVGALIDLGSHQNIVSVLDHGVDAKTERQFIALDWIEGDLSKLIASQSIKGWDDFYERFGSKILEALSFAYERQYIHRDIKPSNILLDINEAVLVADFGISKFKEFYGGPNTLRDMSSTPYAPPERDSGEFENTKDVHAFAVLALECVIGREIQNYEDLYHAFNNEFDGPDEIVSIFGLALEVSPPARPANVTELLDGIEDIQRERRTHWIDYRNIPIFVKDTAKELMYVQLSETNPERVYKFIEEDIAETFGVEKLRYSKEGELIELPDRFAIVGASFRYQLSLSNHRDYLSLDKAVKLHSGDLDYQRERAWQPKDIIFCVNKAANSESDRPNILYLIEGIENHDATAKIEKKMRAADEVIFKWDSILRFRESLEIDKETPIKFRGAYREGNHLHLISTASIDGDLSGQARFIDLGDRKLSGEIDTVDGDEISFYPHDKDFSSFPEDGLLEFDTRASRRAIYRQKYALDSIKFGRSVRPDLKEVLLHPDKVNEFENSSDLDFFSKDLDNDKKTAIAAALHTKDFLVVEGPPGTGKTKFISELVLQEIYRNPDIRILLSSQTNIALDNALEQIRDTALASKLEVKMVRIGRWGDPRISLNVQDLLLEASVGQWLKDVEKRSGEFLGNWAEEHGVSRINVDIGMAMLKLVHAKRQCAYWEAVELELRNKMADLEFRLSDVDNKLTSEQFKSANDDTDLTQDDFDRAKIELRDAKKRVKTSSSDLLDFKDEIGDEVPEYAVDDLVSLADDYIGHEEDGAQLRKLIEIQEEWLERFGHSEDFFSAFVVESQIVAGTCIGFAGRGLQDVEYDLCIVDEASKASINEVLVPVSRARRWIIVGDPKQLPPFVANADGAKELLNSFNLSREDIKGSIFDYFEGKLLAEQKMTLNIQYRMTRAIGNLVSNCFYDGSLISVVDYEDDFLKKSQSFPKPVTWFSTSKMDQHTEIPCHPSFKNLAEIDLIKNLLLRINLAGRTGDREYSVALLSGYGAQITELKRVTANYSDNLTHVKISCNTVDSFQGRQADIAIYSVTRSNKNGKIGFLKEIERLNVALSRGRWAVGIVGDDEFCRKVQGDNPFFDVLSHISQHSDECSMYENTA
jgi:serine/threonine protein kinase